MIVGYAGKSPSATGPRNEPKLDKKVWRIAFSDQSPLKSSLPAADDKQGAIDHLQRRIELLDVVERPDFPAGVTVRRTEVLRTSRVRSLRKPCWFVKIGR